MSRRSVPTLVLFAAAALVALLAYGVFFSQGDDNTLDQAVSRGARPTAPALDLRRPVLGAKDSRSLTDFRGKVVVLNFWASWCTPCKEETPDLRAAQEDLKGRGDGTVLGVTHLDASTDSVEFVRSEKLNYPSLRDPDSALYESYGGRGVPETIVIDKAGKVVAIARGVVDAPFLQRAIAAARKSS